MPETAEIASDSPCTEIPNYRRTLRRTTAHVAPSPNDKPDLFRVSEVAAILRVSPTTIYRLTRLGELQCVHVGPRSIQRIPKLALKHSPHAKSRLTKASERKARHLLVTDAGRVSTRARPDDGRPRKRARCGQICLSGTAPSGASTATTRSGGSSTG